MVKRLFVKPGDKCGDCGKPAEHHHELRNIVPPPPGSQWSSDREYYPNHEFV